MTPYPQLLEQSKAEYDAWARERFERTRSISVHGKPRSKVCSRGHVRTMENTVRSECRECIAIRAKEQSVQRRLAAFERRNAAAILLGREE